jgi:hypothetical protein
MHTPDGRARARGRGTHAGIEDQKNAGTDASTATSAAAVPHHASTNTDADNNTPRALIIASDHVLSRVCAGLSDSVSHSA